MNAFSKCSWRPFATWIPVNLESEKARGVFRLLGILVTIYVAGVAAFFVLSIVGELYPETWDRWTTVLNGMKMQFTLEKAGPMLGNSLLFFCAAAALTLLLRGRLLRPQIIRTIILALALLSLAYLGCAVLLLVVDNRLAHFVVLAGIAVLGVWVFFPFSNLRQYLDDRECGDFVLECLVAGGFLLFIGRMMVMALGGGQS